MILLYLELRSIFLLEKIGILFMSRLEIKSKLVSLSDAANMVNHGVNLMQKLEKAMIM